MIFEKNNHKKLIKILATPTKFSQKWKKILKKYFKITLQRNAKIILLDKENSELKNKEVLTESSINDISGKVKIK